MPQRIEELIVNEVSLVDRGSNRGARVALFKRDSGTVNKQEKRKMKFKQILKSAKTRDEIVAAVRQKAEKIAKKEGIGLDRAEAKAWAKGGAAEAYEAASTPVAKRMEPKMFKATAAEAELDRRARKRVKKTGVSYPKACSEELAADPTLYQKYEAELAAGGGKYDVPEQPEYMALPKW